MKHYSYREFLGDKVEDISCGMAVGLRLPLLPVVSGCAVRETEAEVGEYGPAVVLWED
ncbi:MAG: hypothetical protein ACOCVQ_02770 [Bacillota bacterium]